MSLSSPHQILYFAQSYQATQDGKKPVGLEIAGQGAAFAELGISGVACCLTFPPFLLQRETDASIALVPGDISDKDTWNNIRQQYTANQLEMPNFILATPADGGCRFFPKGYECLERVIKPSVELASQRQAFVILGEAPETAIRLVAK